jgi:hypothetical protein
MRKAPRVVTIAVTVKAWNAYLAGKNMSICRFDPDRELFPDISAFQYSVKMSPAKNGADETVRGARREPPAGGVH